ncbi:hypothetical protein HK405_014968, partial [Cladochytrium tenue]
GGTNATGERVGIWLAIGLVFYFSFGFWWSKHRHPEKWPADELSSGTDTEATEVVSEKKEVA